MIEEYVAGDDHSGRLAQSRRRISLTLRPVQNLRSRNTRCKLIIRNGFRSRRPILSIRSDPIQNKFPQRPQPYPFPGPVYHSIARSTTRSNLTSGSRGNGGDQAGLHTAGKGRVAHDDGAAGEEAGAEERYGRVADGVTGRRGGDAKGAASCADGWARGDGGWRGEEEAGQREEERGFTWDLHCGEFFCVRGILRDSREADVFWSVGFRVDC